jgi:hypothetical protein
VYILKRIYKSEGADQCNVSYRKFHKCEKLGGLCGNNYKNYVYTNRELLAQSEDENNHGEFTLATTILNTANMSLLKWSSCYRQKIGWQFRCCQHGTVLLDVIERVGYRCCFKEQNIKLLEKFNTQIHSMHINSLMATYSILELHVSESMASEAAT